jgi:hypothetical protein
LSSFAPPPSIVIGILLATVLALLFRSPPAGKHVGHRLPSKYGSGYYENAWRGEEAELWNWIEERVGMWEAIRSTPEGLYQGKAHKEKWTTKKKASGYDNLDKLGEQEVMEAIKVTKQRLGRLEQAVLEKQKPVKE